MPKHKLKNNWMTFFNKSNDIIFMWPVKVVSRAQIWKKKSFKENRGSSEYSCSFLQAQDSNDKLPYWLSNSSTLLVLLQQTLKRRLKHQHKKEKTQRYLPSIEEAKYPVLLFKGRLTTWLDKFYRMIRDNLKTEISPLLGLCIQVWMNYQGAC